MGSQYLVIIKGVKEKSLRSVNTPSGARSCRPHISRELLQHWAPGWKRRCALQPSNLASTGYHLANGLRFEQHRLGTGHGWGAVGRREQRGTQKEENQSTRERRVWRVDDREDTTLYAMTTTPESSHMWARDNSLLQNAVKARVNSSWVPAECARC